MSDHRSNFIAVAQAEDTDNLLDHIAWTDVVKPALDKQVSNLSKQLIAEALGSPIPGGLTREQLAGMCYGINFVSSLFERILTKGKKALEDLDRVGLHP